MTVWMVVEDEPDIYEMVLGMYELLGVEGLAFANGEDAIAWIEEVDEGIFKGQLPELVLLDIRLPGDTDGVQVGARIRQSPILKDIVMVLMTAYHLTPQQEKTVIKQSGSDKFLRKPLPDYKGLQRIFQELIVKPR